MKSVKIKFDDYASKTYSYLCPDETVAVGDHVIVDSPSSGYVCVKVLEIVDGSVGSKEIVCKVDDSAYLARKELVKEREKIIKDLTAIDKKAKDEQRFAYLATLDPSAASLLARLKEIDKTA